jgi:glycosyltransferase involved in cell wall biosynthesis
MLISVIISVYNAEKYIHETISSILNQTYRHFELLLIDDGSTDDTARIIKTFNDPRIIYHYKKNEGVSAGRTTGVALAKGDALHFFDADDYMEPLNLELKQKALYENNADFVYSDVIKVLTHLNKVAYIQSGQDKELFKELLLWEKDAIPAACSNILLLKKCFGGETGFNDQLSTAADQLFKIELSRKYKGKRVPVPLIRYRIHDQGMSKNIRLMESDHIKVYTICAAKGYFKDEKFKRLCFANLYYILAGSFWNYDQNKILALRYFLRSLMYNPGNFTKLFRKNYKF